MMAFALLPLSVTVVAAAGLMVSVLVALASGLARIVMGNVSDA